MSDSSARGASGAPGASGASGASGSSGVPGWPSGLGDLRLCDDVPAVFVEVVLRAFAERADERFRLALSGGPTAQRCYERLAAAGGVDWTLVDVYMGDERCVPPDDPDANQRLVRESLLDRVAPVGSFHPMSCDEGAPAYQAEVAALDAFDLIHLGVGPDGHTASLFTGSDSLQAGPDTLALETSDPNERNPHRRMTLTLPALAKARQAVFTVSGDSKRDAITRLRAGEELPAALVPAAAKTWIVDREAFGSA